MNARRPDGLRSAAFAPLPTLAALMLAAASLLGFAHDDPWLEILNLGRVQLLLAALIGLVACLLLRRPIGAVAASLAVAINLAIVWPWLGVSPHAADPGDLRLVSFNVKWDNPDLPAALDWIRRDQPDVVVLVETWKQEAAIAARLGYPYRSTCPAGIRCNLLVLSRRPFEQLDLEPLHEHQLVAARFDGFTLLASHLVRPFPFEEPGRQLAQVEEVGAVIRGLPGPLVMAGDFNTLPWTRAYGRLLDNGLAAVPHLDLSWPAEAHGLGLAIDHVLTRGIAVTALGLGPMTSSDHLPVIASVRLPVER